MSAQHKAAESHNAARGGPKKCRKMKSEFYKSYCSTQQLLILKGRLGCTQKIFKKNEKKLATVIFVVYTVSSKSEICNVSFLLSAYSIA